MPLKRVHKRYPRVNIGVHEEKLFNFNKVLLAKYNTVEYYTTLSAGSPRSNKIRCYGLQIKCIYLILQEVYYWVLVNMMAWRWDSVLNWSSQNWRLLFRFRYIWSCQLHYMLANLKFWEFQYFRIWNSVIIQNDRENYFVIGWEQANLWLILDFHCSANYHAHVCNFLSELCNKWVIIVWKLEQLRIYTTCVIQKCFQIAFSYLTLSIDFTLSNAWRFYSSKGDPWEWKG